MLTFFSSIPVRLIPVLLIFTGILVFQYDKAHSERSKGELLDKIVAVVGNHIILHSDIEGQLQEYEFAYDAPRRELRCMIVKEMVEQHLLIAGAIKAGIEVDEEEIDEELNRRMQYFIMQVGSEQALEEYYGQPISELKNDLREPLERQLRVERKKNRLLREVEVTPKEVSNHFHAIPEDSLPYYDTEVELAQIVIRPEITRRERQRARERIEDIRSRIIEDDENFQTLAILYSDDEVTSRNGGETGMRSRENLDGAYAAAAFQLEPGHVSRVVESEEGFHIIQKIERLGDRINTRHILIKPSVTAEAEERAEKKLDSIRSLIVNDSLTFYQAATRFSDDQQTRSSGGLMMDRQTGSTRISVDNLPSRVFFAIDTLNPGEISRTVSFRTQDRTMEYRIFKLSNKIPPHRANLDDDYPKIRQMALQKKRNEALQKWLNNKSREVFIRIDENFQTCSGVKQYIEESP